MGHGVPELVLESNGRTWTLDPSRSYALGRDPQGELVFDDARVSWRHATISFNGRGWVVDDHGSTNGTFVHGQRVQQMELGAGTVLNLGNATDGPRVSLSGAQAPAATPQAQPHQQAQQQPYAAQGANAGWA
ncbi:FHA domain-containing protein, partial [Streptomyces coelicoflavus]|nr:FHA domain-containing protein [Streptomyces coelicoflavus]